jgi:hypothetical protein
MTVEADPVAAGTADQIVYRTTEGLADDIPERDLNAADRGNNHSGLTDLVEGAVHAVIEILDVEGIFADDELAEILDGFFDDRATRPVGRIAEPDDALIGMDFDKDPGRTLAASRAHQMSLDLGDLHITLASQ